MSIEIKNLEHTYSKNTIFEFKALDDVSLNIEQDSFTAIIGKTGSGKSSLIQHLNAILLPDKGEIIIDEFRMDNTMAKKSFKSLRKKVGLVFQFSEYQLFEETILKDVMFGPINFGVDKKSAEETARRCLSLVNIDEKLFEKSPFELSGGQKRRVAIAGILAMDPDILVLDEPTIGLDPQGAIEIMNVFIDLKNNYNKTLVLVSHDMDFVYKYADEIVLMNKGKIIEKTDKVTFFNKPYLNEYNIDKPKVLQVYEKFVKKEASEFIDFDTMIKAIKEVNNHVK
ncbi:MAG: energy-coupling factor transporter ATPase [Erysipelotrichales bacterium]